MILKRQLPLPETYSAILPATAVGAALGRQKTPFKVEIKKDGQPIFLSHVKKEAADKIADLLKDETLNDRRRIFRKIGRELEKNKSLPSMADLEEEIRKIDAKKAEINTQLAILNDLEPWIEKIKLEKPPGSMAHSLQEALLEGKSFILGSGKSVYRKAESGFSIGQVFLVEHDWNQAFSGAKDFDGGGEWKLPYEIACFEFQITGIRVCALAKPDSQNLVFAKLSSGWVLILSEAFAAIQELIANQIRAICISLDAEVAESDVVRAPHKLNRARQKLGRLPLADYHVIKLAHRTRAPRLENTTSDQTATRKRLHFRRGHWRHYENHKTWIRWMLVGDPDLGFIDKEYRL